MTVLSMNYLQLKKLFYWFSVQVTFNQEMNQLLPSRFLFNVFCPQLQGLCDETSHQQNNFNSSWFLTVNLWFSPQMNSSISKADPSKHAGQVHTGPGLQVLRVPHSSVINQSIVLLMRIMNSEISTNLSVTFTPTLSSRAQVTYSS